MKISVPMVVLASGMMRMFWAVLSLYYLRFPLFLDCKSLICSIFDTGKYVVLNGILQLIIYFKEKNAILFTYPPPVSHPSFFVCLHLALFHSDGVLFGI